MRGGQGVGIDNEIIDYKGEKNLRQILEILEKLV